MSSFIERVGFERKVLKLINRNFPENQLTGLTLAALDNWKARIKIEKSIFDQLVELSTKLKLINQRSGEVFSKEYAQTSEDCELLFKQLSKSLSRCL